MIYFKDKVYIFILTTYIHNIDALTFEVFDLHVNLDESIRFMLNNTLVAF